MASTSTSHATDHPDHGDIVPSQVSAPQQNPNNGEIPSVNGSARDTKRSVFSRFGRLGSLNSGTATNPSRSTSTAASPANTESPVINSIKSSQSDVIDLTMSDDDSQPQKEPSPKKEQSNPNPTQSWFDRKPKVEPTTETTGPGTEHISSETKSSKTASEKGDSSDDEIMELDPNEASRLNIFNRQRKMSTPNGAAPVPHFPPGSTQLHALQTRLQERFQLLHRSREDLALALRKRNAARGILSRAVQAQRDNQRIIERDPEKALDPKELQQGLAQAQYQLQIAQADVARFDNRIRTLNTVIVEDQRQLSILAAQAHPQSSDDSADAVQEALRKRFRSDNSLLNTPNDQQQQLQQQQQQQLQQIQQQQRQLQQSQLYPNHQVQEVQISTTPDGRRVYGYPTVQSSGQGNYTLGFQSNAFQPYNPTLPPTDDFFGSPGNSYSSRPAAPVSGTNLDEASHLKDLLDNIQPEQDDDDSGLPAKPEGMRSDLYKHQKLGLAWLIRMEKSKSKGGLLADDMGLGKTIQTIALLMARKSEDPQKKTTLIVAPVSLLRQWYNEIKLHTTGVSVGIYHGVNKTRQFKSFADIQRFDVVMTSYSTLSYEFKKHYQKMYDDHDMKFTGNIMPDHGLGGEVYASPFYVSESTFYRVVLDEAQNIKNKLTVACKAVSTLSSEYRLCLTGTPMQNSVDELFPIIRFLRIKPYANEEMFRSNISLPLKSNEADDYDKDKSMKRLRALLRAILLRRNKKSEIDGKPILNLPEKHVIDQNVSMAEDEFETYKSIENQLQTRAKKLFMQDSNFSNFLVLLLRLRQACCHTFLCELGGVGKLEQFRADNWEKLYTAVENLDADSRDKINAELEQCLLNGGPKAIEEAEDKSGIDSDDDVQLIELLSQNDAKEQSDEMMVDEPVKEESFKEEADIKPVKGEIGVAVEEETVDNLKLGDDLFEDEKALEPRAQDGEIDLDQFKTEEGGVFTCPLCFIDYTFESAMGFPCGHKVCEDCVDSFVEDNKTDERSVKCFECGSTFPNTKFVDYKMFKLRVIERKTKPEIRHYVEDNFKGKLSISEKIKKLIFKHQGFEYSTKMSEALTLIEKILVEYPGEKIILFSQFTSFFELLKVMFNKSGIPTLRYDGTMSLEKKDLTIQQFYQNDQYRLMLTSLKAGNVGLTLNCASHVIIMDPFWNPYVEEQAMDRAHRIGQKREVFVYRILIANTVEERITTLQNKKKALINAAMDENGIKSVSRLSRQDLRYLFGL